MSEYSDERITPSIPIGDPEAACEKLAEARSNKNFQAAIKDGAHPEHNACMDYLRKLERECFPDARHLYQED